MSNALFLAPLLLLLLLPSTANIKANGKSPVDAYEDGRGASCERGHAPFCNPKNLPKSTAVVPGPLPVLGVFVAYRMSRKLRSRITNE